MYGDLRWRMIGPFRGGRTKAAAGVPSQPGLFYIGVMNGGVWKTTDYGRTWTPIFDDQPTGSIGAIAVAPSDPEHHLRRQRRRAAASRPLDRRRHLQVDRRRARRGRISACATASRFRRSSSIRAIRTGCSSRCSAIRTARTRSAASSDRPTAARTFQKVLYKDENTGARRRRARSGRTRTRLRRAVGGAAGPVGERRVHRPEQRRVQVDGRRHHVAAARRRACRRSPRMASAASASPSRRACRSGCSPRSRRDAQRRPLSLGRCRRDTGRGSTTTSASRADRRRRLRRGQGRSEEPRHRLHRQHRHLEIDRRRQDVHRVPRRAGRRRLSPHLDQSRSTRTIILLAAIRARSSP